MTASPAGMVEPQTAPYILKMEKVTRGLPVPLPEPAPGDEQLVRGGFWTKMRKAAKRTSFAREAVAAYYCAADPAAPTRVRLILLAALAYFIMPVDAIPDFIAGLGFTDDAAVLFAAWRAVGPEIKDHHRERARAKLEVVEG
jgi:uncharacterized membrane protein YkvA (DUF1232 family)